MSFFAEDILEGSQPPKRPVVDLSNSKKVHYVDDILNLPPPKVPRPDVTQDMAFGELYGAGVGKWFTDKALGVQQRALETLKLVAPKGSRKAAELDAQLKELERRIRAKREEDAQLSRRFASGLGQVVPQVMMAPIFGKSLLGAMGQGAIEGATEPTLDDESTTTNALKGAAIAGGAQLGTRALVEGGGRLLNSAFRSRQIPERAGRQAFADKEGVELSLGDLTQNRGVMRAENWMGSVPFSGRPDLMERQTGQILDMLNKRLESSVPRAMRLPTQDEVAKMPVSELRKHFAQDAAIQNVSDAGLKNMHYEQLVAAGLKPRYGTTGEAMVDMVRQGYARERGKSKRAYDAVSQLAKTAPPVTMTNLREAATKALDDHPDFFKSLEDKQIMKILEDIKMSTQPRVSQLPDGQTTTVPASAVGLSFDDARKIRSVLGNLARQADRRLITGNERNPQAVGALKQLYSAATKDLNDWGSSLQDPAVASAYKLANKTFVQGVQRLRDSKVSSMLDNTFDDDKAYSSIVIPGGRNVAEDALFAMGPEGRQVLEYALLQDLIGHGTKPAYDPLRAVVKATEDAPKVTAMAQDFAPGQFINRARLLRDPISVVINDDQRYLDFLRTLDLVGATRRSVEAAVDPMTGNRLAPIVNVASTKGAAIPTAKAAQTMLNKVGKQLALGKPVLEPTNSHYLAKMLRQAPPALALSIEDIINDE